MWFPIIVMGGIIAGLVWHYRNATAGAQYVPAASTTPANPVHVVALSPGDLGSILVSLVPGASVLLAAPDTTRGASANGVLLRVGSSAANVIAPPHPTGTFAAPGYTLAC